MLNVVYVMDVPSPTALHVCSNDVKDVAIDAITKKMADHASVTSDIATLVEEILHEDGTRQWTTMLLLT